MIGHSGRHLLLLGLVTVPLWVMSCLHIMATMPAWWMVAHGAATLALSGVVLAIGLIVQRLLRARNAAHAFSVHRLPCPPALASQIRDIVDPAILYVLDDPTTTALCVGLLRPTIYVSTGLLKCLPLPALRAALAHENAHRRRRDPLRQVLWDLLAEVLVPTVWTRELAQRVRLRAEILADRHARNVTSTRDLASALLAVVTASPTASYLWRHDEQTAWDARLADLTRPQSAPFPSLLNGLMHIPLSGPLPLAHLAVVNAWGLLLGMVWVSPTVLVCLLQHAAG